MSNPINRQRGWTGIGALVLLLSAGLGAFAFNCILSLYPDGAKYSPPLFLVSVFFFPVIFCFNLIVKFRDIENIDGINKKEEARLTRIIKAKRRQVWIGIGTLLLSAVFTAVVFMLPAGHPLFFAGYNVIGGLLGIGIFTITFVWKEFEAANDFARDVKRRLKQKNSVQSALEDFEDD